MRCDVLGWDLGGAHLKAAAVDGRGQVIWVRQLPCPLWQGLEQLDRAMQQVLSEFEAVNWHAVTMTGELVDLFASRREGVEKIVSRTEAVTTTKRIVFYAGLSGFLSAARAIRHPDDVASVNWMASAQLVAQEVPDALFVDIGSTTTDIVPIRKGAPVMRGMHDWDRLAFEELVYTGAVRTPIMALADRIPFGGDWIAPMAEHFATMADVYRLTGELDEETDQLPTADNSGKSTRESARRLARMVGRDFEAATMPAWRQLAEYLAELQLWRIRQACERILSRSAAAERVPLVGAGVGQFLVKKLAERLERRFRTFEGLIEMSAAAQPWAAACAPAIAVALLAREELRRR
jgi:(4-(4-[2-(gamma-L-glutamylamino)ethyl]phenoxymethyl)furan-2-yl)methanamine synthase